MIANAEPRQRTLTLTFLVVKVPSAYNAILGRPSLNAFRAVVLMYHLLVKFSTSSGVDEIRRDQLLARQRYSASLRPPLPETLSLKTIDSRDEENIVRAETMEELLTIALDDQNQEKQVKISSRLNPEDANELTKALWPNADIFAWSAADMPGISS